MAERRVKRTILHRASRLLRCGLVLAGTGLATTAAVAPQAVPPASAPAAWLRYAEAATRTVTALLQADDETAVRLRGFLAATRPTPDQPTAPLIVRLWLDRDGRVTRIAFTPFVQDQANADLRALIVGRTLAGPPPSDMLLPLRIALQLDAPSKPTPASLPGAPHDGI